MEAIAPSVVAVLWLALFVGALRWLNSKPAGAVSTDAVRLFLVALAVRVVAAVAVEVWLELTTDSPFLFGFLGDDYRYHAMAEGLARRWSIEGFVLPDVLYTRGFEVTLGTLYWLTYPSVIVGRVLNVVAGALIPVAVYRLVRDLGEPETAWLAGVLAALFPPLVFWSTVLYKDTLLTLAILVVLGAGFDVVRLGRLWTASAAVGAVGVAMIAVLRLQSVLIVALAIAASALSRGPRSSLPLQVVRLLVGGLVVWLAIGIFSTSFLSGGDQGIAWYLGLDRIDLFYEARSIAFETRYSMVEDRFLSTPVQFIASFFLPLPLFVDVGSQWQATEHVHLAGNVVWLWLLFYVGMALWKSTPDERWRWLPMIVMVVGTAAAIAVRGYAMIYRHKVQMYPFAIMLGAMALTRVSMGTWPRHRRLGILYGSGLCLVIVIYNYLRVVLAAR